MTSLLQRVMGGTAGGKADTGTSTDRLIRTLRGLYYAIYSPAH